MDLVPVIDLLGGVVVRGIGGERSRYRPVESQIVRTADPLEVCLALQEQFAPASLYVADLDAIQGGARQSELLQQLAAHQLLAVDAAVRTPADVEELASWGVDPVIGLETLNDIDDLSNLVQAVGPARLLFSLDLRDGLPLHPRYRSMHPMEVAALAIEQGVHRLIVLDLAGIGMSRGVTTLGLCHALKNRWPDVVVWTGGGVRSVLDLHRLVLSRLDGVLVASALHDGGITPADWQAFRTMSDGAAQLAMDG